MPVCRPTRASFPQLSLLAPTGTVHRLPSAPRVTDPLHTAEQVIKLPLYFVLEYGKIDDLYASVVFKRNGAAALVAEIGGGLLPQTSLGR